MSLLSDLVSALDKGSLKIVDVQPKFSNCDIVEGGQGAKKGDIVRLEPKKR